MDKPEQTGNPMRVVVMQPYLLPYIGYFQLMAAADKFVALDDVNYINRGWINRNRLPSPQGPAWFTIPLVGASQNKLICELDIKPDDGWKRSLERTVSLAYSKAPHFDAVFPFFQELLNLATGSLSVFLSEQLQRLAHWLGISTHIVPTSRVYPKEDMKGEHRILSICRTEQAKIYLNPPGGRELYTPELFLGHGVQLQFLRPTVQSLQLRHSGEEGPVLSILDLMMLNPQDSLREAVRMFQVEDALPA
jgi:hypothetical protein